MKKILKTFLPIAISVAVAIAIPHLYFEGGCSCHAPLIVFGNILGCSEAKQPDKPATAVNADNHASVTDTTTDKNSGMAEHKVTFVEIGSVNCIPCKMMQPIMRSVEMEYKGQVKIVFHDVWTAQGKADARKYRIRVIPTQVFLDNQGNEYFRHEGFFPKSDLVEVLKRKGVR